MKTTKIKKHYYVLFFLFLSSVLYGNDTEISIKRIFTGTMKAEQDLLVQGLLKSYSSLNETIQDLTQKLPENITGSFFDIEKEDLKAQKPGVYFIRAMFKERVVGYASFEKTKAKNEIYIRQLIVDPDFERKGIGKKICFDAIFELLPNTEHIVVITRKANSTALGFYHKLGFQECNYMHEGFSPELFIGLEYFKKEINS